jgi:hypothetical protein
VFAGRRFAVIGAAVAVVWYFCIVVFWAMQPLTDTVPVGIDYTLKQPAFVSVSVTCRGLFESAPRTGSPLPALKPQPKGLPKLAFQRDPCVLPHKQAQIVFAVDSALFAAIVGCFAWLALRRWRSPAPVPRSNDRAFAGSVAG